MEYRIDKAQLLDILSIWNSHIKRKVCLVACGGTALTLLDLKESTKDVDFLIPDEAEYKYLIKALEGLGYEPKTGTSWRRGKGFEFDLFVGKKIFTTELLESSLEEGNNTLFKEFSYIYLGILNYYDLLISKIFRFTSVDMEDCLVLFKAKRKEIDIEKLKERFYETSSYDVSDERNKRNFRLFLHILEKEGFNI
ncbi:MAG: DUF6036 family nucleotidyltransferase [Candidatus Omnitrophota bacterium]